ncbi:MAG: A/G-specific adenine glycosylase [Herpetosiphonaceae bacterium]|nr:A/G-specific adenine glycosylase [Herpetosiphonaceae bacterium]
MVIHPDLQLIRHALLDWFRAYGRKLPWRETRNPYHVLVSEIMLQQTQVDRVKPKYAAFLEQFPTLEALAAATPGDVIRAWSGLGYNRRALNLQRTAQAVLREHDGVFPQTAEALQTLPGIGPYTAGALACFAFEQDVAFMDTNIRRVIRRVFVGPADQKPAPTERELLALAGAAVPPGQGWSWNQAIMELGALICTATRPRCQQCPLRAACRAYQTWRIADEQLVLMPQPIRPVRAIAERSAPFHTSNRFFRGRVIAALRPLPPGAILPYSELGPQVKPDWNLQELDWLKAIVAGLADDGLVAINEEGVRLP